MHARRPRRVGAVLAFAAVLAVLGALAGLPRRSKFQDDPRRERAPARREYDEATLAAVAAALEPPDEGQTLDPDAMAAEIADLGLPALSACAALVCGVAQLPTPSVGDRAPHPHAFALRERVLDAAIERFHSRARLTAFAELAAGAPIDVRCVAIRRMGAIDHHAAASTLLDATDGVEAAQWKGALLGGALHDALARQLAARPESIADLRARARDLEPEVLAIVLRAAARTPAVPTVEFALDHLGRDDTLDLAVLSAIAALRPRERLAFDETALSQVRRRVESGEARVQRAAIDACGSLGDMGAVELLVARLDCGEKLLEQAAHRALVSIVGEDHGRAESGWRRWIDSEDAWREREWDRLIAELDSGDAGRSNRAAKELVTHRRFRDEAAEELAGLAERTDAPPYALVAALASTSSHRALGALLDALEHGDENSARIAADGLRRTTGADVGDDVQAWRALLAN